MMTKIDQKKLIDAGAVDQVKAEITKSFQQQLDEANQEQDAGNQLYDEMIGGRFGGSKFISEKMAIPADMLQARFGQNFKIEDGKVVAYDGPGNKVSSAPSPASWLASMKRWNSGRAIPQKDHILKASGNRAAVLTSRSTGRAENHETRRVRLPVTTATSKRYHHRD
jgi:hypothetical protein